MQRYWIFLLIFFLTALGHRALAKSSSGSKPQFEDIESGDENYVAPSSKKKASKQKTSDSEESSSTSTKPPSELESSGAAKSTSEGMPYSGVVRIVRGSIDSEVFFRDLNMVFVIPNTKDHNKIMEACLDSQKSGQSISFRADPKSHTILSLDSGSSKKAEISPSVSTPAAVPPLRQLQGVGARFIERVAVHHHLGAKASTPMRRQSSICSTKNFSRSAPSISEERTAAMTEDSLKEL